MALPVRPLPVLQNWDCHSCGGCCREYQVLVTEEERRRIQAQGWEREPGFEGLPLFVRWGSWWSGRYRLNQRADGACVFLSEQGRCRIHERFGADAKPRLCQLYPFVPVPAGDHWRVGVRFACPSAAANRGRPVTAHAADISRYAEEMDQRSAGEMARRLPPPLEAGQVVDWPDLQHFVDAVLRILGDRSRRVEQRLRHCVAVADLCGQARFDQVKGDRLVEFLEMVLPAAEAEVPEIPERVFTPTAVGRLLFRQAAAQYLRIEVGPNRGRVRGRLAVALALWRFARGKGPVPRVHAELPETTFERLEAPAGPLPQAAEELLERYYAVKVGSLQFCGETNFGMSFWEGLRSLVLTFPVILWLARALSDHAREEAVTRAVRIVDYNFGYNPLLGTRRQRAAVRQLARRGELQRLVAWYSR